ncbi:cytochrome P450 [Shinella sp. PSBB067]|uniref:cytochrome P450 n=1 Tax=Shinella sp. PSBB067 TaxID=2715959 RepID=UPI00193BB575|nr:cytochrome P450 [Shinella sp. PSBB067]QRI63976.1 cytochrome P450 [Shinella sp. PSBB067]
MEQHIERKKACPVDWDPRSPEVLADQIAAYDRMRETCPVAYSDYLGWSVFGHEDVLRILGDHETFSNVVSRHPSVPNGMDPPEHTLYRRMIEPYFAPERIAAFEPVFRRIARGLVDHLGRNPSCDVIREFAEPYAVRIQCGFLGWPESLHAPLLQWVYRNRAATLARDPEAMAAVPLEFDGHIRAQLEMRERAGADAADDLTTCLLRQTVGGRRLDHAEIVSILRNWTVGELGTIAACVGIILHFLAGRPDVQARLRGDRAGLAPAIDEILRLHGPLISNRRVATRAVTVGGHALGAGDRITVLWASANRDGAVFADAEEFHPGRDQSQNLLYGAGIHVCPGAQLARMQLSIVFDELLDGLSPFSLLPGVEPVRAVYPASGFSSLFLTPA